MAGAVQKMKACILRAAEFLLHSYHKKNFYYRIMIPFAIFSTIIVCVSAGGTWYLLSKRLEQKMRESNYQILKQVQQYSDEVLYSNALHLLNKAFLGGTDSSYIDDFFTYGVRMSSSSMLKAYQEIVNSCAQEDYIAGITIYNRKADILLDNEFGLRYHARSDLEVINPYLPFKDYLEYTEKASASLVYYTGEDSDSGARSTFTLIKSIPLYSLHSESQGFVAFVYDEDLYMENIARQYGLSGELMILSPDKKTLIKSRNFDMDIYTFSDKIWEIDEPQKYNYFTYDGVRYCMMGVLSEQSGWGYLSYIPVNILNADTYMLNQISIMLIILTVLFANVIVHWISGKVYRPIHVLSTKVQGRPQFSKNQNELSAIEEAFTFLENQVDDIRKTIKNNKDILLYKTLISIIYNNDFSGENILKSLELCGISFQEDGFCVVVIEFENTVFDSFSVEEREYMAGRTKELLDNWFYKNVTRITEVHPDNQVITLINLSQKQFRDFCGKTQQCSVYLQEQLHIKINYAVSAFANDLKEIRPFYKNCLHYLQYSFIYGYGNVFTPEQIEKLDNTAFHLEDKDKLCVESLLHEDRITELESLLTEYSEKICGGQCSLQDANLFMMQIYKIVFHICTEAGVFAEQFRKEQIVQIVNDAVTLNESMECIYLMLHLYHETVNENIRNEDIRFITEVTSYIQEHCNEEVTLTAVANAFQVAPSHLSRLFKSVKRENFSNYVIDQKLTIAADRLKRFPDKSISQIAEELGYYTPAYFTRLFRAKYGVTPSQYRKMK